MSSPRAPRHTLLAFATLAPTILVALVFTLVGGLSAVRAAAFPLAVAGGALAALAERAALDRAGRERHPRFVLFGSAAWGLWAALGLFAGARLLPAFTHPAEPAQLVLFAALCSVIGAVPAAILKARAYPAALRPEVIALAVAGWVVAAVLAVGVYRAGSPLFGLLAGAAGEALVLTFASRPRAATDVQRTTDIE